jgi:hypothetical protein
MGIFHKQFEPPIILAIDLPVLTAGIEEIYPRTTGRQCKETSGFSYLSCPFIEAILPTANNNNPAPK